MRVIPGAMQNAVNNDLIINEPVYQNLNRIIKNIYWIFWVFQVLNSFTSLLTVFK